jgi:arylsulfatase
MDHFFVAFLGAWRMVLPMMKNLRFYLFLCVIFASHLSSAPRPNIVVILADDMGFSDLGCYGSEIETPNLDRLAAQGLRFTQFTNAARCCPTRASLLTGLYSHQAGIGHMVENRGVPSYQGYLNDRCVTIAEALKPAGYATLMAGKWHVGSERGHWPLDRGFDRYWGTVKGGGVYFKQSLELRPEQIFVDDAKEVEPPDDLYVTDTFTDRAMSFVEESVKNKKPFFLYLAHIAPHWPLQAKPEEIAKYQGRYDVGWDEIRSRRFQRQKDMGLVPADAMLSVRAPQAKPWNEVPAERKKELAHRMEIYAAQIDAIDRNVGRLIEKLKQLGQFDDTLLLFLSDNGSSSEGGPGGFDRGIKGAAMGSARSYLSAGLEWANASNTPFLKYKIDTFEGGITTPLIVHGPESLVPRGQIRHQPAHIIDIMPTVLDLVGATYPAELRGKAIQPMEGVSLKAAFQGAELAERALFWEHQDNAAIRQGEWKAVRPGLKAEWQLFHIGSDRTESKNLTSEKPEKLETLKSAWEAWARRVAADPYSGKPSRGKNR